MGIIRFILTTIGMCFAMTGASLMILGYFISGGPRKARRFMDVLRTALVLDNRKQRQEHFMAEVSN